MAIIIRVTLIVLGILIYRKLGNYFRERFIPNSLRDIIAFIEIIFLLFVLVQLCVN